MEAEKRYVREMDRKLNDWKLKIGTVQLKARLQGKQSEWLEHALRRHAELESMVGALRDADEDEVESGQARIAIAAEEFEVAMVRAGERFQASRELGLDPAARKERQAPLRPRGPRRARR